MALPCCHKEVALGILSKIFDFYYWFSPKNMEKRWKISMFLRINGSPFNCDYSYVDFVDHAKWNQMTKKIWKLEKSGIVIWIAFWTYPSETVNYHYFGFTWNNEQLKMMNYELWRMYSMIYDNRRVLWYKNGTSICIAWHLRQIFDDKSMDGHAELEG